MPGQRFKWWQWAILVGVVVFIIKQPAPAAHLVTRLATGFGAGANQFGTFLSKLGN